MSTDDIKRNQELIEILKRRKHKREVQLAQMGITADPSISIDIENIDKWIEKLEKEVESWEKSAHDQERVAEGIRKRDGTSDSGSEKNPLKQDVNLKTSEDDVLESLVNIVSAERGFVFDFYRSSDNRWGEFGYCGLKVVNRLMYSFAFVMADNFDVNDIDMFRKRFSLINSRIIQGRMKSTKATKIRTVLCYIFQYGCNEATITALHNPFGIIFGHHGEDQEEWIVDVKNKKLHTSYHRTTPLFYSTGYNAELDYMEQVIRRFIGQK